VELHNVVYVGNRTEILQSIITHVIIYDIQCSFMFLPKELLCRKNHYFVYNGIVHDGCNITNWA